MRAAIRAGASIINDVNALQNPGAIEVIAESNAQVCLMHMQGKPRSMQNNPQYANVANEVSSFLQHRMDVACRAGIGLDRIIIDPGFGFGKSFQHNIELFQHLDQFTKLNVPVLVGLSRKSMLGTITVMTWIIECMPVLRLPCLRLIKVPKFCVCMMSRQPRMLFWFITR